MAKKDKTDGRRAIRRCGAFEAGRMAGRMAQVPLLWWQRIIVIAGQHQRVGGIKPSHLIGQDLEDGVDQDRCHVASYVETDSDSPPDL